MPPGGRSFPYTVRVVSGHPRVERIVVDGVGVRRIAGSMMDAGVPTPEHPVAGVAMGLVMNEENGKYAVLTDIAGAEDHYGDMDFKVAGTTEGDHRPSNGHQGVGHHDGEIMPQGTRAGARGAPVSFSARCRRRWSQSRARCRGVCPAHRHHPYPVDKIRDVIGPGGKMIRSDH